MVNQLVISGKIFNKNAMSFEDNYNQGQFNYSTTLIVAQRVADGKGYNGSNYDNKFYNLNYSTKALSRGKYSGQIEDGAYVMVVGRIAQKAYNDKTTGAVKSSTHIIADEIVVISQKQAAQNYSYNPIAPTPTVAPNFDDDSILWDD